MIDSKETLARHVESEVMACIGCNDCMLACPLAEAQIVTIAELNAAVHLPTIYQPNVMAFVTACTQCGQCVPACPADLSRADMVLYNKMKVEDTVPDYILMLHAGQQMMPSRFTLDGLAAGMTQLRLFEGVAQSDLRRLVLKSTVRRLAIGEQVYREGEFHERLYIVLEGSVEQTATGPRGERLSLLFMGPGSFFGEMAVMADQPEPFTVAALEPSIVLEIPKAAARQLMNHSQPFRATMDDLYRQRALWTYTRKPSALGALPEQAMSELLDAADLMFLAPGQTLLREGDPPLDIYVVRSGFLRVSRTVVGGDLGLLYLREGDMFGAMALLMGERGHWFTLKASCRSEVIRFPGGLLRQVVDRYPHVQQALLGEATQAEQVARANAQHSGQTVAAGGKKHATMVQPLQLEALVDAGLAQGSEVLVVDQNRCTNCRACVDACGRRHGLSRLELRGLQLDNLLFPAACRHCEDPVCLLCSVNGIQRLPSGEITIVDQNCIGCGACAERCPYGNIRMHPVEQPSRGVFAGIWSMLRGPRVSTPEEVRDPKQQRRAVKCDLCAGYGNYACVTACPTGAAARVDPRSLVDQAGGMLGLRYGGHRG